MNERVLEHEILKALFTLGSFAIESIGSEESGFTPIYKRDYSSCHLHYGTLVDIINNPEKYEKINSENNKLFFLQKKVTKRHEIDINHFEWYVVSDALELMKANEHIEDKSKINLIHDSTERVIQLKYKGAIAYIDNYYLKEYKKSQLSVLEEERINLDVERLRLIYFDYPQTQARANVGYYISILTVIIAVAALIVSIVN